MPPECRRCLTHHADRDPCHMVGIEGRLRARVERYRDVLQRITLLVGEGEAFETAQRAAEAGLRGWDPAAGQPLSTVVPQRR